MDLTTTETATSMDHTQFENRMGGYSRTNYIAQKCLQMFRWLRSSEDRFEVRSDRDRRGSKHFDHLGIVHCCRYRLSSKRTDHRSGPPKRDLRDD